jgi:glycine/D-amino acid oxidase-like deaminating enzyme
MQAMRRASRAAGVTWRTAEVAAIEASAGRATGVRLSDGTAIEAGTVIVTAGTATPELLRPFVDLPVRRRKRLIFYIRTPAVLPGCPLLIDPTGVYIRPEGEGFICGTAPPEDADPDVAEDDFDITPDFVEERVWPVLAARIPALEHLRVERAWAGHYDLNIADHNALVGPVPGVTGLFAACGFSGHGIQQAPAIGRGLAELTLHGRYLALDLAPLALGRLAEGRLVLERNVV